MRAVERSSKVTSQEASRPSRATPVRHLSRLATSSGTISRCGWASAIHAVDQRLLNVSPQPRGGRTRDAALQLRSTPSQPERSMSADRGDSGGRGPITTGPGRRLLRCWTDRREWGSAMVALDRRSSGSLCWRLCVRRAFLLACGNDRTCFWGDLPCVRIVSVHDVRGRTINRAQALTSAYQGD